jgi:hypothetical protein
MATVTPNFNWPVPTSTDLVKDGATAIEALGDSIDASLVDLKGGTTGQVLSKTSGTDMDFTWVTSDDANAIQNTIVDAKGDLIAATAADTPARLAVGTNGQVLTADSTAATGLAWATASGGSTNVAGKNVVLNSAFNVWQRGTSVTFANGKPYGADRWQAISPSGSTSATFSQQATNDTTNLPNIRYAGRIQRTAGNTVQSPLALTQCIETENSVPYAGKQVTLSFYARRGANFSGASNNLSVYLYTGTGTDQNVNTSYTGLATPINNQTAALTTTWQRFTFTATLASTATEIAMEFTYTPLGTAGAADHFEITGVQLEIAGSASAYSPNTSTYQAELAACQRYYATSIPTGYTVTDFPIMGTSGAGGQIFWATGTSDLFGSLQYPVALRTTPTFTAYSGNNRTAGNARDMTTGSDIVFTPSPQTGNNRLLSYVTVGATATSGRPYGFQWTASAEL